MRPLPERIGISSLNSVNTFSYPITFIFPVTTPYKVTVSFWLSFCSAANRQARSVFRGFWVVFTEGVRKRRRVVCTPPFWLDCFFINDSESNLWTKAFLVAPFQGIFGIFYRWLLPSTPIYQRQWGVNLVQWARYCQKPRRQYGKDASSLDVQTLRDAMPSIRLQTHHTTMSVSRLRKPETLSVGCAPWRAFQHLNRCCIPCG